MKMKLHLQPKGSTVCGQHCVAMLAGITPAQSIAEFGTTNGTTTRQLATVLSRYGYRPANELRTFSDQATLPRLCVLKLNYGKDKNWHWVVYKDGLIYCPGLGIYDYKDVKEKNNGAEFTSYLELNPVREAFLTTPAPVFTRTRALSEAEQLLLAEAQEPEHQARYTYHDCEQHGIFKVDNQLGLAAIDCPKRGKCRVREVFDPKGYAEHHTSSDPHKLTPAQDAQLDQILSLVDQPGQSDAQLRAQMEQILGCKVKGSPAEMLAALKQGLAKLPEPPKPAAPAPQNDTPGFPPAELKRRLERVLGVDLDATPEQIADGFREGMAFIDWNKEERPEPDDEPEEPAPPPLTDIEHYASLQFTGEEVCTILGLDYAREQYDADFLRQMKKGQLIQVALLRANIFQHAKNGSTPAQEMALKLIEFAAVAAAGE